MSDFDNFDAFKVPERPVVVSPEPLDLTDIKWSLAQSTSNLLMADRNTFAGMPAFPSTVDPSLLEAAESGFKQFGIITGFTNWAMRDSAPTYYEPGLNIADKVQQNEEYKSVVAKAMSKAKAGDRAMAELINQLQDSRNSEELDLRVKRITEYERYRQTSQDSDWIPWLLGAGAGISLDLAASAATLNPLGVVGTGANIVTQTSRAARIAASRRVATFGAVEGGVEAFAQSLDDPGIQMQEIAAAIGLGGVFGAILGSAAPKFFGQVVSVEDTNKILNDRLKDIQELEDASLGAAKVNTESFESKVPVSSEELTSPTAIRGTGSEILSRIPLGFVKKWRSPKRRLADAIKQATEDKLKGLDLNSRLAGVLSRMYKISTMTGEDIAGQAREETMQEGLERMHTRMVVHEVKTQNIYDRMTLDIYGVGSIRNRIHNHELMPTSSEFPTQAEFRHAADIFAQARGEGDELGMKAAISILDGKIPAGKNAEFENAIREMANHDDKWFKDFGEAEVELGFIKKEELIPGYRPQNWNAEMVGANMTPFTEQVRELISSEPDMEFVRDAVVKTADRRADEAAEQTPEGVVTTVDLPLPKEGEEWADFLARIQDEDPELVKIILDDWDEIRRTKLNEAIEINQKRLEAELRKFGNRQVEEVLADGDERIARITRAHLNLLVRVQEQQKLVNQPSSRQDGYKSYAETQKLDDMTTRLARLERRIETEQNMMLNLRKLKEYEESLRMQIGDDPRKAASLKTTMRDLQQQMREAASKGRGTKAEVKKLKKQLNKANRAAIKSRGAKRLDAEARRIADAIRKNRNPGGFHVDDALETSRFFKHRALNLKGVRHLERWQRFLNRDSGMNMEIYTQAVGRQLEMRRKYLPFLRKEGLLGEDETDVYEGLTRYLQEGLENDVSKVRETLSGEAVEAEIRRLNNDFNDNTEFMERAFGEFTRSDHLRHANEGYDRVGSIVQSLTTAMALGMSLLASIADVAIGAFAGTRVGTGIVDLLRPLHNSRILDEIAADNELLATYMRGARVLDNGMIHSRLDIDSASLQVPGGIMATIQRKASSIAQVEMWTNLLHGWNRWVRGSFGVGFMRQISKDLKEYDSLRPDLKGFYAKHGIGADEARKMSELFDLHSKDVSGIRIPDLEAWTTDGYSDLVDRFYRAVNGAGNEALLDPGLGDRPFLRANPLGRLVLQFQSFTYAAGERWFAPLVQLGMMRPYDARVLWSGTMALALAGAGSHLRDTIRGEESKLSKALESGDSQDIWRVITEAYLRSPYVTGVQGTVLDVMGTQFADPTNRLFQAITGTQGELVNPEYIRFKQNQGPGALAGPAFGMIGTGMKFARDIAEGDMEAVQKTAEARLPVANTLPVVALRLLVEQLPGD